MQLLVSLEWATEYFAIFRPKANEWDTANDMERQRYLGWASVLIKSAFVFQEDIDVANDDRVRIATCEQALWLMRRTDTYPEVLTKGIVSAAMGGGAASATFSKDFIAPLICEEAKLYVSEIGYFVKSTATVKTMPLGGIFAELTYPTPKLSTNLPLKSIYCPMTTQEVTNLINNVLH